MVEIGIEPLTVSRQLWLTTHSRASSNDAVRYDRDGAIEKQAMQRACNAACPCPRRTSRAGWTGISILAQRHGRYDEAAQQAADEKADAKSCEKRDGLLVVP